MVAAGGEGEGLEGESSQRGDGDGKATARRRPGAVTGQGGDAGTARRGRARGGDGDEGGDGDGAVSTFGSRGRPGRRLRPGGRSSVGRMRQGASGAGRAVRAADRKADGR